MKKCPKCKIEKERSEFYKNKTRGDGLEGVCKNCTKKRNKQYNEIHKEELKEKAKQYRKNNKDKIKLYEQSEKRKQRLEQYNLIHEEKLKHYRGQYYHIHKEKLIQRGNERNKRRRKNNICFKLKRNVSNAIWWALKENNSSKRGESTIKYLPYTIQQLKQHLESQFESWMNWNNYGRYEEGKLKWQIDHIIPQSLLPYDSMSHPNFQKCWSLFNLRPLEAMENIKKGNR
jgi:hypothetical protein